MRKFFRPNAFLCGLAIVSAAAIGCGEAQTAKPPAAKQHAEAEHAEHGGHGHDGHEHAAAGPHGGALIELGDEEYHGELLHDDDTHAVTVYVLDSKAENTVPIEAKEIAIEVEVDGKRQEFPLTAVHLDQDDQSKAFCFEATNEALCFALDEHDAKNTLKVDVNGKQFAGKIEHSHDHGHAHDHEGHEHGDEDHKHEEAKR